MAVDYLGGVVRGTFTVAGNGTAQLNIGKPKTKFTLKVIGTGATPTAWSVVLEGSLDDTDYTTILTHASGAETNAELKYSGASNFAVSYFRSRVVSLTLGSATDIVVSIYAAL